MKPCKECGSTKADRFEIGVFGYGDLTAACRDVVGCKRRWKVKKARDIQQACASGRHAVYANGRCMDCGADELRKVLEGS